MKITDLQVQKRNPDRVNVYIDGTYRFSLAIAQVTELGIKIGAEVTEDQLQDFLAEGEFGKLYMRALEYCMLRPHSAKEVRDYLWRKTLTRKVKNRTSGVVENREGVARDVADRVFDHLTQKGYIDDLSFARRWVEMRNQSKGTSLRKLSNELRQKGVEDAIIEEVLENSDRNDSDEIKKVIDKKRNKYDDENKLIAYLLRQGFRYDDIRSELNDSGSG